MIRMLQEQLLFANNSIRSLTTQVEEQGKTIASLRDTISSLEKALTEKMAALGATSSKLRGVSKLLSNKSERQDARDKGEKAQEGKPESASVVASYNPKDRGNNGARRNMHYELETVEKDIYPTDPDFDARRAIAIGARESVVYSFNPMTFTKTVYRLHTYRQDSKVFSCQAPLTPLFKSSYDSSFIAGIAQLRYMYSMPVERIVSYFTENGFEISKATANGLLQKTADLCANLYKALHDAVLSDDYIGCDETYHKVLVEIPNKDGRKVKKAYIWVMASMTTGLVYYFYDDGSRSEKVIMNELQDFHRAIQSDAYAPYKKLGLRLTRLSCLQHCKRKFLDLEGDDNAGEVVSLMNELYRNDHKHKVGSDGWTEDDNYKWRRQYAPPILARLKVKLQQLQGMTNEYPPKSEMHNAAEYVLSEWEGIENIFQSGKYSLDNNAVERVNRLISLSRRNSLFFGSHNGASNAAVLYSLACSCKMHKVNFFNYLTDVLNKVASTPPNADISKYRDLLPDRWAKE